MDRLISNARSTNKEIERELSESKALALLQDSYDTIEALIEAVEERDRMIEDKDQQIDDLKSDLEDAQRGEE